MKSNHKNRKRCLVWLFLTVLLVSSLPAYAADRHSMPQPEERTDSLTVECVYTDKETKTPIDGMELCLTKVADLEVTDGAVNYKLLSEYASSGIDFTGMTASESLAYAQVLSEIQTGRGLSGTKQVTAQNGRTTFGSLEHGMYLLTETGRSGTAEKFELIAPSLVMVPEITTEYAWNYDVLVIPKPTMTSVKVVEEVPPKTTTPPRTTVKTGDDAQLTRWTVCMAVSLIVIVLMIALRRKRADLNR